MGGYGRKAAGLMSSGVGRRVWADDDIFFVRQISLYGSQGTHPFLALLDVYVMHMSL